MMVSIRDETFQTLCVEAKDRGITIQELLRAVIVPDWIRTNRVDSTRPKTGQLEMPISSRENQIQPIISRPWARSDIGVKRT